MENETNKYEKEFYIAGVQYHRLPSLVKSKVDIKQGTKLDLVPEPTNNFDPNAIQIIFVDPSKNTYNLGYVPKRLSSEISAIITLTELECKIVELTPSAKPWEMCKVIVREI